ncbi:MAG: hypothetical protein PUA83_01680 [Clostridiales bacterium]|nr:hypothetical protein [Clostridiales bacterium]
MSFMSFVRGMLAGMITATVVLFVFFPNKRRTMRRMKRCCNRATRRIVSFADEIAGLFA